MTVFVPDEPSLGSVDEVHAVGGEVLPANFIGVVPQRSDLKTDTHTDVRVGEKIGVSGLYCANLIKDSLSKVVLGKVYLLKWEIPVWFTTSRTWRDKERRWFMPAVWCFRCATGHCADTPPVLWWSWPVWSRLPLCQKLWTAFSPSRLETPVPIERENVEDKREWRLSCCLYSNAEECRSTKKKV